MDGSALDEDEKAFPLVRDDVKAAPANRYLKRVDVLDYLGLG